MNPLTSPYLPTLYKHHLFVPQRVLFWFFSLLYKSFLAEEWVLWLRQRQSGCLLFPGHGAAGKETDRCTTLSKPHPPSSLPAPPYPTIIKFWICIHLAFMVFSRSTIWAHFMCGYITHRIFFFHGKDLTERLSTDRSDYFNTLFWTVF